MKPNGSVPTWALIIGVALMVTIAAMLYGKTVFSAGITHPDYFAMKHAQDSIAK